jgi:hypothetical protein
MGRETDRESSRQLDKKAHTCSHVDEDASVTLPSVLVSVAEAPMDPFAPAPTAAAGLSVCSVAALPPSLTPLPVRATP